MNSALLSYAEVYVLQSLSAEELSVLIQRARAYAMPNIEFDLAAIDAIITNAHDDVRRLLNVLEQICNTILIPGSTTKVVDQAFVENALTANGRRFNKGRDQFYDQISALHKSARGSNSNAALYWLCRMLDGGADLCYLARQIIRMAWEDIGLADLKSIQLAAIDWVIEYPNHPEMFDDAAYRAAASVPKGFPPTPV